jgi:hypothetical protein
VNRESTRLRRAPLQVPLALLAVVLATTTACGKRGDPQPPFPKAPAAISDLAAEQEGGEIVLTFTLPARMLSGEPLTDLAAIEVWRATDVSASIAEPPAPPQPGEAGGDRLPGYVGRRAATEMRNFQERFLDQAKLAGTLAGESLASATRGSAIVFRDPLSGLLSEGKLPARVASSVIAVRSGGQRSPLSNIVVVTPEVPPGAPAGLSAKAEEGKVALSWTAPAKDLLGGEAKIGGYFVYRLALPETLFGLPLNSNPVIEPSFTDERAPYADLVYTVRAVLPEKPKIEGPAAPEVAVEHKDVYAPAAPARLDALPESGGVRLVWDPSPATDLAGYIVERAPEGGAFAPLTPAPIAETVFVDPTAAPGVRYRYGVRAVDKAGNRGEAVQSPVVSAQEKIGP